MTRTEEIRKLALTMPKAEIARQYGISRQRVGVLTQGISGRREIDYTSIHELYQSGTPIRIITKRLQVSKRLVNKIVQGSTNRKVTVPCKVQEALYMRSYGMSWADIADTLGYKNWRSVYSAVYRLLHKSRKEVLLGCTLNHP